MQRTRCAAGFTTLRPMHVVHGGVAEVAVRALWLLAVRHHDSSGCRQQTRLLIRGRLGCLQLCRYAADIQVAAFSVSR